MKERQEEGRVMAEQRVRNDEAARMKERQRWRKMMERKSPASLSGGGQSNKKIRGEAGKSTPTFTTARASLLESPQRKAFSAKKWVNVHSPYRHHRSPALSTGGLS
jgi:hypothetical protein